MGMFRAFYIVVQLCDIIVTSHLSQGLYHSLCILQFLQKVVQYLQYIYLTQAVLLIAIQDMNTRSTLCSTSISYYHCTSCDPLTLPLPSKFMYQSEKLKSISVEFFSPLGILFDFDALDSVFSSALNSS